MVNKSGVKCLVQPGDGVAALVKGIDLAKKSVDILIFRFDHREVELALGRAVSRGVKVHALTAFTNRGGEKNLRALELRLLAAGATVDRTADDLVRYHGKMMIVDGRELFILAFNFTHIDIDRSRSFGFITTNAKLVQEACRLFEADCARKPYTAGNDAFLVSPVNARKQLVTFIGEAKKELCIYDPEVSDPEIIRLLQARARAGVNIRVIGKMAVQAERLASGMLPNLRLHARVIVRDGSQVFLGSQSLRTLELDSRREVGVISRDKNAVALIAKTFEADWAAEKQPVAEPVVDETPHPDKVAKQVAKAILKDMPPMAPVVAGEVEINAADLETAVKSAVKDAVREVVRDFVTQASQ